MDRLTISLIAGAVGFLTYSIVWGIVTHIQCKRITKKLHMDRLLIMEEAKKHGIHIL